MPHGTHNATVGARRWDDSLYVRSINRSSSDAAAAGGFLAQAEGGIGSDLGAAKDSLEGEAHGEFEAGAEEAEEVPHGGVEEGVN